jgi:AraC family transcriptional regulator, positive regulator of tynA and feaB
MALAQPAAPIGPSVPATAPERWHVNGSSDAGDVMRSWADALAATHLTFDVRATPRTPDAFQGVIKRRSIGELQLVDCAATPFLGNRGDAEITAPRDGAQSDQIFGFQCVHQGVEMVREGARELALTAGDIVLWDGREPTEVEIVEAFFKRTLMFPRERVLAVCPRLADLEALPSLHDSALARLLLRYMNALAAELPALDQAASAAAADVAIELLRAAVEPGVPTSRACTRAAMRAGIRRYVRGHLQEPLLGPATIARAHALSVRALHALFEDTDTSVAGLIRSERLARCLEDLRRPNGGSVTEIAFRWGFCDAAHFSRVFKREYGLTPSDIRRAATGES